MTDGFISGEHCPADDLGAYLDGELPAERQSALERHIAGCTTCNDELNFQKKMLLALESPLPEAEIELPKDFTKRIVTNAESRVDGLRRPKERLNALFICAALLLFSLFALGADASRTFAVIGVVFDTVGAVVAMSIHFILDIGLVGAVIVRTLFLNIFSGASGMAVIAAVVFVAMVLLFSRYFLRQDRA